MHPHPVAGHEQARVNATRRRGWALLVFAAWVSAGAAMLFGAALPFCASAQAAEPARVDRVPDKKPAARKKTRGARDTPFGREGDPKKATRTIRIEASDTMRYFPEHVTVKKGQTVRFNVHNAGALPHEMVIGTMDELKKHAETVKRHGEHAYDDAPIAHVEPGETGRIVWQFTRAGEFYYGCLVPGHFEAGMIGTIVVR